MALPIDPGRYRIQVQGSEEVNLAALPTGDTAGLDREQAGAEFDRLKRRLAELQGLLWANRGHGVLVVLQAIDTGGKDGTIRHVFSGVNPQGVRVWNFRAPSEEEAGHDFLWRIHAKAPGRGEITVFNRSHYESVLVERVKDLVPEEQWRRRFRHIREFERTLCDEGTTIVKFLLHISKDEQRQRLQARLDDPAKRWKFDVADLAERERWDAYQTAFSEMLSRTSEPIPWHVVPADRKWFRNLVVASVLVQHLEALHLHWPAPDADLDGITVP